MLEDIPTGSTAAVLDHHSNTWTVGHVLDRNERRYKVELVVNIDLMVPNSVCTHSA